MLQLFLKKLSRQPVRQEKEREWLSKGYSTLLTMTIAERLTFSSSKSLSTWQMKRLIRLRLICSSKSWTSKARNIWQSKTCNTLLKTLTKSSNPRSLSRLVISLHHLLQRPNSAWIAQRLYYSTTSKEQMSWSKLKSLNPWSSISSVSKWLRMKWIWFKVISINWLVKEEVDSIRITLSKSSQLT